MNKKSQRLSVFARAPGVSRKMVPSFFRVVGYLELPGNITVSKCICSVTSCRREMKGYAFRLLNTLYQVGGVRFFIWKENKMSLEFVEVKKAKHWEVYSNSVFMGDVYHTEYCFPFNFFWRRNYWFFPQGIVANPAIGKSPKKAFEKFIQINKR